MSSSHEPREFVSSVNAFVQAARNVTFRLQAYKSEVPEFDAWYLPWQEAMKASPTMRWAKEARNKVVKERGLQSLSSARVKVIASYQNQPAKTYDLPPFVTTDQILASASQSLQRPDDRLYGVVEIERCWVLEDMPDWDALALLGDVYRFIDCMLHDFVTRTCEGLPGVAPEEALAEWSSPVDAQDLAEIRSLRMSPHTGGDPGRVRRRPIPGVSETEFEQHYGNSMPKPPKDANLDDPVQRMHALMPMACAFLEHDGSHITMFQFRHRRGGWRVHAVEFIDRMSKFQIMDSLADTVRTEDIDAFVFIGEGWVLPQGVEQIFPFVPPTEVVEEMPGKSEALMFAAAAEDGTMESWLVPFEREGQKVLCPCNPVEVNGDTAIFDPIRAVWGSRPLG